MNRAIRRAWIAAACVFVMLLGTLTYIQFFDAKNLQANTWNSRTLYESYGSQRGSIVVDGMEIASSVESNDGYAFQRTYSQPELYAGLTGYFSSIYGATGLESAMNDQLSGNSDAQFYDRLAQVFTGNAAQGASVELTIDSELQQLAYDLAEEEHIVFAPARYEGIDERVLDWAEQEFRVLPVSIGDYVLYGGEVAVMVMIEAITRLIPGAMGNPESLAEESHTGGLLEYPVYTKPATWRNQQVPPVLLSGNHGAIARWRRDEQIKRTFARRPDMVKAYPAENWDRKDRKLLQELHTEQKAAKKAEREAGLSSEGR